MNSILNKICNEFPQYNISKQCAPTFVKFHTSCSEEVIFVSVKGKTLTSQATTYTNRHDSSVSELELTGSPLKLDLSLHNILDDTLLLDDTQHWQKEETFHYPVKIESARLIINFYNKLIRDIPQPDVVPLWVVCNGGDSRHILLLGSSSYKGRFNRNIVSDLGKIQMKHINFKTLENKFGLLNDTGDEEVCYTLECKFRVAGMPSLPSSHKSEDLLTGIYDGATKLYCHWNTPTLDIPLHNVKIQLEQKVIIGHTASPCMGLWKSISALHNVHQILISVRAAGHASFDPAHYPIRVPTAHSPLSSDEITKRLRSLIADVEQYSYLSKSPRGGCIFIADDNKSLTETLHFIESVGSSNDFTFRLWDILKECGTADELINLLIQALKSISSGKVKPFINPSNTSYLAKLVMKLARGHSQTSAVLRNLKSNPLHALTLTTQLGLGKAVWEYTHLLSTVDTQFGVNNVLHADTRSSESVTEVINQTLHDMTLGGGGGDGDGDMTLNPFESRSAGDMSLRLSLHNSLLQDEDVDELTVDNFASLKKLELNNGSLAAQEQPLMAEQVDMSGWSTQLVRLARLHTALEHLRLAHRCLRLDTGGLKKMWSALYGTYSHDKSPVRTVGQLMNEPLQSFSMPIHSSLVHDHINGKFPSWYRVTISRAGSPQNVFVRDMSPDKSFCTYLYSQRPVFPPSVWEDKDGTENETNDNNAGVPYNCTQYSYLTNAVGDLIRTS